MTSRRRVRDANRITPGPRRPDTATWVQCSVRGCRGQSLKDQRLAICDHHALLVWEMVEHWDKHNPMRQGFFDMLIAERNRIRAEAREVQAVSERDERLKTDAVGDVYYARVGTLIKVGWTSDLYQRMRSYGADCELLLHYPGTRADETNLHRQLTPSRAKGREWYFDDEIVRGFIATGLKQHGKPRFAEISWTKPKQIVAGKRHRGAA